MTRILVAEDSPTQARELEILLRSEGYEVELAPDGRAALDRLNDSRFDLLLSDVQMPRLGGYELCKAIRNDPRLSQLPVILLTRLFDPLDIVRGLECGADNFVNKPFERDHLITRIKAVQEAPRNCGEDRQDLAANVECMGQKFSISTHRGQMLNFLMSTFDEFVRSKQRELETKLAAETRRRQELFELTRELQSLNTRLTRLASVDPLTELLNRRGVDHVLSVEISRSERSGNKVIAALVDLDHFKLVNDRLGHAVGDLVLAEVAKRLASSIRPTDRVGRVGGDEFLIMLPDTEWAEAQGVADRVRLAIAETPLSVFEDQIRITASIGTAELPSETCSIEEVLTLTREGLHNAKDSGGNRVCATPRAGEENGNGHGNGNGRGHRHDRKGRNGNGLPDSQIDEIRQLLRKKGAFRAVSQPIYNLADESVAGYELLSRGPQGPFEMPADFFRICLEDNFLTTVDLHCLKNCVAATANLEHRGRFHVNLFPSTLLATPPERLISLLQTDDDSVFCIEMSEQQFLSDPACLMEQIAAFKKAGILVAMDDVGFGRSSLEALVLLEPDLVKIDPSCVSGISAERRKLRSFERLIRMAQSLDAEVVAEGIETTADLALLRDLGVGYGQGFLWGRPS